MKSNVVMLHIGRCGSTVLGSSLDQHPEIQWGKEIFRNSLLEQRAGRSIFSMEETIAQFVGGKNKSIQVASVKYLDCQNPAIFGVTLEQMMLAFKHYGFQRFIVLHRKNHLRRMISHCIAQQTKHYFVAHHENAAPHMIQMNIDAIRVATLTLPLLDWFDVIEKAHERLQTLLDPHTVCSLTYEDDIENDPLRAYTRSCGFLEVESIPVQVTFNRTNPYSSRRLLSNYQDIVVLLQNTPYQWMLDDEMLL